MISWEIAASVVVTVVSCAEKLTEYILSQNLPLCFFPGAAFDVDGKKKFKWSQHRSICCVPAICSCREP